MVELARRWAAAIYPVRRKLHRLWPFAIGAAVASGVVIESGHARFAGVFAALAMLITVVGLLLLTLVHRFGPDEVEEVEIGDVAARMQQWQEAFLITALLVLSPFGAVAFIVFWWHAV